MASENKKQINQYTIDLNNVIGEGSYSVVYKGLNEDTQEVVAIKIIKMTLMADKYIFDMIE